MIPSEHPFYSDGWAGDAAAYWLRLGHALWSEARGLIGPVGTCALAIELGRDALRAADAESQPLMDRQVVS